MKKIIISALLIIGVLALTVYAFTGWTFNVNPGSCSDSDMLDLQSAGYFQFAIGTQAYAMWEFCDPNNPNNVIEFACGSDYGVPGIAGVIIADCGILNTPTETYECKYGACVAKYTNNTNGTNSSGNGTGNNSGRCSSNAECPPVTTNTCQGTNACTSTTSYVCQYPGTAQSQCIRSGAGGGCQVCTYGCSGGFCRNGTNNTGNNSGNITCYSSAQCPSQTTKYCSGSSACSNTTHYMCSNAGTPQSRCIQSGGSGGCGQCTYGCAGGECQNGTNQTSCLETDSGIDFPVLGTVTWQATNYTDYCLATNSTGNGTNSSFGSLREYYCSNPTQYGGYIDYQCQNTTCTNGACS